MPHRAPLPRLLPWAASGVRDVLLLLLLPLLCCCSAAASAAARGSCCVVLLLLLLLLLTQASSRRSPHGVGRPEIYYYAFPPRAPTGSPAPTVVPGVASGVHDVLLLPLFIHCPGATALYVLLLFCSAAIYSAADLSTICFCC